MDQCPHFINGAALHTQEASSPIYCPAEGRIIASVNIANQATIEKAITSAKTAFLSWSQTTPAQRSAILFRYKALLDANIDKLAAIVTREHGKSLIEAKGSIQRGIDVVNQVCGIPQLLEGRYLAKVASDIDSYSLRQPVGVCLGITPFNFPAMIPLWMFPMAIACGNTFILKPSEKDPTCAYHLAELAKQAGVPDGVINVVNGDHTTVDLLITHPDIHAVSFVGSSHVAEKIYHTAITHHKRAQTFGGAKNHAIVMPDADITNAADLIVQAAYGSSGERCMAISVVVAVGDETADELIAAMLPQIETFEVSPLITAAHRERVRDYIASGIAEGALLVLDQEATNKLAAKPGFYLGACLFDQVKPHMKIYREEIFGPVLCVMRVNSKEDAIKLINEHEYGNGTAIFTRDGYTAKWFAANVQAGMVGLNVPVPVPVAQHSFGGWKRSSFTDTSMFGPDAIHFFTKLKTVTERWIPEGSR